MVQMAVVLRVDPSDPDLHVLGEAATMIARGLVVAYPTDTLYGLAVDPRNAEAVRRLFALKGRPESSALTLIASGLEQVRAVAEITSVAERLAEEWWPGPLTIVLRSRDGMAAETLAGGSTVGVRVPDHAVARALARAVGFCVTATSANRSGDPPVARAAAVVQTLPGVDGVLDAGESRGGPPSTIVDASNASIALVRAGAIAWERVLKSVSSGA
jgi:L-threonylcarbamoyladenylate synthase